MHRLQKAILDLSKEQNITDLSLRKLGALLGEQHPQKIKHHLNKLRLKGFLSEQDRPIERTLFQKINLISQNLVSIPILGAANCGVALRSAEEEFDGFLKVSSSMVPKKKSLFAVRAVGSSMDKADIDGKNIESGDYVIISADDRQAQSGDYVLSIINGAANIKKFICDKDNKQVILVSESTQDLPPIYIHKKDVPNFFVNGKVIMVIKKPSETV